LSFKKIILVKNLIYPFVILFSITVIIFGCGKGSGNYSVADHTTGIANVTRSWSGSSTGFVQGDTLFAGDTTHYAWPKAFSRTINDTSFSIQKINGFEIAVIGYPLNYLLTDSVTNHMVKFDSTIVGSPTSFLEYFYGKDSMYFEFHQIGAYNSRANQYYQVNISLHTNH
jgi:hypothetical protein